MSGAGYTSHVHTNYAVELPAHGGPRRWALKVEGVLRVFIETSLEATSRVEARLENKGQWSPSRARFHWGE